MGFYPQGSDNNLSQPVCYGSLLSGTVHISVTHTSEELNSLSRLRRYELSREVHRSRPRGNVV